MWSQSNSREAPNPGASRLLSALQTGEVLRVGSFAQHQHQHQHQHQQELSYHLDVQRQEQQQHQHQQDRQQAPAHTYATNISIPSQKSPTTLCHSLRQINEFPNSVDTRAFSTMSLFGSKAPLSINTGAANSGATATPGGGLFGGATASTQPSTGGGLFGGTTGQTGGLFGNNKPATPATGGLFGGQTNTTAPAQPQQQQTGLFGTPAQPQQQQQQQPQTGGLFGGGNAQNQQQTPAAGGGLFGQSMAQPQQQQSTGGLFGGGNTQNQNQQTPAPGGLFGGGTTQNQQTPAAGGLFGQSQAQNQAKPGGLFGASTQQQNNSAPGLTMGQSTAQQTVPGVRIDASNIKGTTRFNDLEQSLQSEMENIDIMIQRFMHHASEIKGFMAAHGGDLSQLTNDVNWLQRKYEGVKTTLDEDIVALAHVKDLVKSDADVAKMAFAGVDQLKLPAHYHQTWLTRGGSGGNTTNSNQDRNMEDVLTLFSNEADRLKELHQFQVQKIKEMEQHMPGVEHGLYERVRALRDQTQVPAFNMVLDLLETIKMMGDKIYEAAGGIVDVREKLTQLQRQHPTK
ncbi:Nucleoporin NUP49 [Colletotrichum sidae]|uniref:Nucleoporin NUP49 n=1 Tax=Colletotrichum sidae TaxID=1347389 RepID=A0A4R8TI65_9PEZI|nr:Nucleoporin NUP49 [Colletotrichum sidae]